jgi:hypothetical protein
MSFLGTCTVGKDIRKLDASGKSRGEKRQRIRE